MIQQQKKLLLELCDVTIQLKELHSLNKYHSDEYKALEQRSNDLSKDLLATNYPVYTITVSGCCPSDMSNYDLGEMVAEEFKDLVMVDCEQSQFFCYCVPSVAEKVLTYVKEHGKEGGIVTYYSGDTEKASFSMYSHIEEDGSGYMVKDVSWNDVARLKMLLE